MPFAWNSPQKPNRYAVNNTIQAINRYTQSIPLVWNSPPKTNCYAVDGAMPLARAWVVAGYLFSLADLLYLPCDGIDLPHASCMIIFELVFFCLQIIFSPFHPFTFRFPTLPKDQPLCGSWHNITCAHMGRYELSVSLPSTINHIYVPSFVKYSN